MNYWQILHHWEDINHLLFENNIHVYVQKPLTHNIKEARLLTELARNKKKGVKAKNKFELNAKVSRYLFAKGYESELIKEIVHRLDKV